MLFGTFANFTDAQKMTRDGDKLSKGAGTQNLAPCSPGELKTVGNAPTNGTTGNIVNFTNGLVNAKASAFSRRNDGLWQNAYLGAYTSGVGVTDVSETGAGSTAGIDNDGGYRNYVLFEFDSKVVMDTVFLDNIFGDSDMTVWIGTANDPYNNHLTLSDALLSGYNVVNYDSTETSGHWVDINAGSVSGNVVVISARADQTDDNFLVTVLGFLCPPPTATVTIIKQVLPLGGGTSSTFSFGFTATGLPVAGFNLVDMNVVGPDRYINGNITAFGPGNPITVTENLVPTWTLSNIQCSETGTPNSTVSFFDRKVTLIAEPDEYITCTFTNTQLIPTAARAIISGRATTSGGFGISGATLTLTNAETGEVAQARTNPFGNYFFDDVEVGTFYVLTIRHKKHFFTEDTRSFTLNDNLTGLDFIEAF
jgi:hypothetical protein